MFHQKDIKLLWSKAAGRCSICRKELSVESSSPSGKTLIGENCHIVGEKLDGGPRHKSTLSEADRNRYPNLILLCAIHHIEIDSDEIKYPVEVLHQIKSDHEIWVQTSLTDNENSESKKFYSGIINYLTESLHLANWEVVTDNAVRTIMLTSVIDGMQNTVILLNRIDWPHNDLQLEKALLEFSGYLDKYIVHYLTFSHQRTEDSWIEDKFKYNDPKTGYPTEEGEKIEKENYRIHFFNLWNLTASINKLAKIIRKNINRDYFRLQGDFLINDDMGVTNQMEPCVYFPREYRDT